MISRSYMQAVKFDSLMACWTICWIRQLLYRHKLEKTRLLSSQGAIPSYTTCDRYHWRRYHL